MRRADVPAREFGLRQHPSPRQSPAAQSPIGLVAEPLVLVAEPLVVGMVEGGRIGTPADIARMVVLLCEAESDFITGQSINVAGGTLVH